MSTIILGIAVYNSIMAAPDKERAPSVIKDKGDKAPPIQTLNICYGGQGRPSQ